MSAAAEDVALLGETARAFFAGEAPVARLRRQRDRGERFDGALWGSCVALGLAGVAEFGMAGVVTVTAAAGATLAAVPLVHAAVLAPALLAGRADLLGGATSGRLFALAVEEGAHHAPARVRARAERDGAGWRLSGAKRFVPWGDVADALIVSAADADGPALFVVDAGAAGLERRSLSALDSRPYADVALDGVAAERLGGTDGLEAALDRGRVALAGEMLGMADALFAVTLAYLKQRTQFGQLIGGFQALQHRAAALATEIELTRAAVHGAAAAIDAQVNDAAALASLAKAHAGATVHRVTNEAIQLHGGIGVTDAADLGLYLKRARVAEAELGGRGFHLDRYATLNGF